MLVGNRYAIYILLAGDFFLLFSVVAESPFIDQIREAEYDHDVIDELYFDS